MGRIDDTRPRTRRREHAAPGNDTGYRLADVDVNAIVTDRYRFECATCTLFFEPIAFDASGDSSCRATHRWGTNASEYEGVRLCESRGYTDSGVSSQPNGASICGGYAQYSSDGQRDVTFPPSVTDDTANSGFDECEKVRRIHRNESARASPRRVAIGDERVHGDEYASWSRARLGDAQLSLQYQSLRKSQAISTVILGASSLRRSTPPSRLFPRARLHLQGAYHSSLRSIRPSPAR